jgi:hypothetical protein
MSENQTGVRMRYLLLIYTNENVQQTPEQTQRIIEGHRKAMNDAAGKGFLRGAEPLFNTASATTVRAVNGKTVLTDGPFAETKEQLAGYYLLECESLDDAIGIARQIPTACGGGEGCVEIRPIRAFPAPAESTDLSRAGRA